jgi:biopolymer transport protein ExbB
MSLDQLIIMGVLVAASIIGLAFIIERGLALRQSKVMPPEVRSAAETCRGADDLAMMRRICQQHPSPLARLLLLTDRNRHLPRAENASGLETAARHEVSRLERGLVILEIVVGIAPLLGLVGTVYGLISLFAALGASGSVGDNTAMSRGIAIALESTLLGLLTAIPSLVAWSYYSKKVETMAIEMASLCEDFLRQLYHHDDTNELAAEPTERSS